MRDNAYIQKLRWKITVRDMKLFLYGIVGLAMLVACGNKSGNNTGTDISNSPDVPGIDIRVDTGTKDAFSTRDLPVMDQGMDTETEDAFSPLELPVMDQGMDAETEDAFSTRELPVMDQGMDTETKDAFSPRELPVMDQGMDNGGCNPDCNGKTCGDDGCGGSCGSCATDYACDGGQCVWSGSCAQVPAPDPIPLDSLPSMTPAGITETTTHDGFTDDYLYDGTGYIKVGTRREWGATVIFFGLDNGSPGINGTNTIDAHDTGREVQVALYDPDRARQGCAWNASCRSNPDTACPASITYLGWDPVQGGNECNHGSGVESVNLDKGVMEAQVRPLFWNPDWALHDCGNNGCSDSGKSWMKSDVRYTQRLRFVDTHVVEIQMSITNLSDLAHAPTQQEFPTLYASFGKVGPDLRVVMDSHKNVIPVDNPANNGFYNKNFESPGGWATLQDTNHDYGVGLYYENKNPAFQAWQKLGVFNNIRSRFQFGLPAHGTVRARAYLILGSFDTIANRIAWLDKSLAPFGVLDTPTPDAVVKGADLHVSGWVLDNKGVNQVEILVDGKVRASTPPNTARPDVCMVWPGYSMCNQVGFNVDADLSGDSPCPHLIEVRARDTDGNSRIIAKSRFYLGKAPCIPKEETCNGQDDDCDGQTDEGGVCDVNRDTHPIYRFRLDTGGIDHMFSTAPDVPQGYVSEGTHFHLYDADAPGRVALYQVWCQSCTDHMQTVDPGEGTPQYGSTETLGWCSDAETPDTPNPLYRLYSQDGTDHFASIDPAEWESAQQLGYTLEGILCWTP